MASIVASMVASLSGRGGQKVVMGQGDLSLTYYTINSSGKIRTLPWKELISIHYNGVSVGRRGKPGVLAVWCYIGTSKGIHRLVLSTSSHTDGGS